jgi:hypothetical protein
MHCLPDIILGDQIKEDEMGRICSMVGMRNAYKILFRKYEEKRPMGRSSFSYEGNIKMSFKEMVYDVMEWIRLVQDRELWQDL